MQSCSLTEYEQLNFERLPMNINYGDAGDTSRPLIFYIGVYQPGNRPEYLTFFSYILYAQE